MKKKIIFKSNLKNITLSPYMEQPRSMLYRKHEKIFGERDDPPDDNRDFDYNFLPNCFWTYKNLTFFQINWL